MITHCVSYICIVKGGGLNQLTYGNINDKVVSSMDPPGKFWMITGKIMKGFTAVCTDRHQAFVPTGDGAADGQP